MRLKQFICLSAIALGFSWLLVSCSNTGGYAPSAPAIPSAEYEGVTQNERTSTSALPSEVNQARKKTRTGIATGFGAEVESAMTYADFTRSSGSPKHVTTIRYNDKAGAKSMGVDLRTKGSGMQKAAGGLIEWGMSSGWGSLSNYWWRGGRFVIGKKGRSYRLKVKNLSSARIEVVLSVDGLDVIDGQEGSVKKRGYIIEPHKTLVVKGFRTSEEAVASFRFSSVSGSYTNLRHGKTRNVGVIGLAFFTEKGREPWVEIDQRGAARPFAKAPNVRARN